jgi:hypothetical protein
MKNEIPITPVIFAFDVSVNYYEKSTTKSDEVQYYLHGSIDMA